MPSRRPRRSFRSRQPDPATKLKSSDASWVAGGPVVVSVLTEARDRTRQANGLGGYLNTALAVQRGTLMTATPTPPNPGPTAAPDWEVLATGSQAAGGDSVSFELATSQNDLQNLWSRAYGTMTSPPPLPDVDFSRSSVAAVFLGTRSSGGYSVDVQNVIVENGELYLDVATTEPAPGTLTTQALTNPWVMVRVDAPNLGSAWVSERLERRAFGYGAEYVRQVGLTTKQTGDGFSASPYFFGASVVLKRGELEAGDNFRATVMFDIFGYRVARR